MEISERPERSGSRAYEINIAGMYSDFPKPCNTGRSGDRRQNPCECEFRLTAMQKSKRTEDRCGGREDNTRRFRSESY